MGQGIKLGESFAVIRNKELNSMLLRVLCIVKSRNKRSYIGSGIEVLTSERFLTGS